MRRPRHATSCLAPPLFAAAVLGSACGGSAKPSPPAAPVVEVGAAEAELPPPAPPLPSPALSLAPDELLLVRCGVDDTPKSVVGEHAPEASRREATLGLFLKPRFIPDPLEPTPALGARAPARTPNALVVPLAAPRARVSFERATRSRHTLAAELARQLSTPTFDIAPCLGLQPIPSGEIAFRVRVASSGVPTASALLRSSLEDDVSRCVVETACRLALPPGEAIDDLEIQAMLAPVAPAYRGAVKIQVMTDVPAHATAKQKIALQHIAQTVQPLAKACAEKSPPATNFLLPLRLAVYANRLGSQMPALGGAVFDIARCFVPKIGEAVGPLDPSLRREKYVRLEIGFQGHEP